MCRYRVDEDDLLSNVEYMPSTNGVRRVDPQIQAQIANLEARIRRVEDWMERLEVRVLYLQRGMNILWGAFLLTLAYAIFK